MESELIDRSLNRNEEILKMKLANSFDIEYREFVIPIFDNYKATIVFITNLVDKKEIETFVLSPLMEHSQSNCTTSSKKDKKSSILLNTNVFVKQVKETNSWAELCDEIILGDTVLLVDECSSALVISTKSLENRAISEPTIESELRGPRDGFIENIQVNISLVRRRIKDYGLHIENIKIGERTKTDIALLYIDSLVDDSVLYRY